MTTENYGIAMMALAKVREAGYVAAADAALDVILGRPIAAVHLANQPPPVDSAKQDEAVVLSDAVAAVVAEYREKLRKAGGMDNELISVSAGGVRKILDAIERALTTHTASDRSVVRAEGVKDAERLDWLATHSDLIDCHRDEGYDHLIWHPANDSGFRGDMREAIDAAMSADRAAPPSAETSEAEQARELSPTEKKNGT